MKKRKGLTLIEVILSITILSLVSLFIMIVFGSGLKNITRSGKRTSDVLKLETEINKGIFRHIADEEGSGENNIETDEEEKSLKVNLPGIDEIIIKGKLIMIEKDNIKLKTFIPDD